MLDFISREAIFYIVAPANIATGGPELLHQLAYKLKENGKKVFMLYVPHTNVNPVHDNYRQYGIDFAREVHDESENVLIVPETRTYLLNEYSKIKKIVWWLSVDNYFRSLPGLRGKINKAILKVFGSQNYLFFNRKLKSADLHLVQSEYARVCLVSNGIFNYEFLGDYLHESFLNIDTITGNKEDIVVYNPKKGISVTKQLIRYSPDIKFVAIENMTRIEVVELLQRAKVYIDFGFHPGKDRIPREAAILGCCVITNKLGSAQFSEDVPIGSEFKFKDVENCLDLVAHKIRDCFINYDTVVTNFEQYRMEIKQQEAEFDKNLKLVFL